MFKEKFIIKDNLNDNNSLFKYYIELIEREADDVLIRGWVYSVENKPVNVELVGQNNNCLKQGRIWRKTRKDVKKKFELSDDYKSEFLIRFERDSIIDENIFIHFFTDEEERLYLKINMQGLDESFTAWGKVTEFITNQPIRRTARFVKNHPREVFNRTLAKLRNTKDDYTIWRENNMPSEADYERQRGKDFQYKPVISISIPLYNTPLDFFEALMKSVINQTYSNFELCLADGSDNDNLGEYIRKHYWDDDRINYIHLDENLGIAGNTNKALEMANGDYVMLTDHDDILEIGALYEIVRVLNEDKTIDIIYTDEDLVDASGTFYSNYRFKPDFNLEMLRHLNYVCHIFVVRRSIMREVGGFREEYDGAQDFDMILRCVEKTDKIHHIPKVLYHWRAHEDSTAGNVDSKQYAIDASVRALEEHYKRVGIEADVEATDVFIMLKSTRHLKKEPLVSILIPTMEHIEDLDKCICSIVDKTEYKNYEIVIIENNSRSKETFDYYENITSKYDFIKVIKWEEGFNYSKINNFGAKFADGEYYILLNNDIEVISTDWINRMLGYCLDEDVGAVGAKLLFEDDTVQHCGVVIGVGGFAGHILTEQDVDEVGYFGRLQVQQEVSAVTAACMMVDAKVFEEVGGFDEEFTVSLNDVDLCLKIRKAGKKIILDPNITMYHYESKSRGYEETADKQARFKSEIKRFREKWSDILSDGDPYYSPNLTLLYGDCSPKREEERFLIVEEIEREEVN
ncbi:MAG TPA: glycosyltransferase family 2 protein [Lachnospiraceae bacterium]|nr:glycosyltransferase family 2 protein [Lachnospiraceae bacterium]